MKTVYTLLFVLVSTYANAQLNDVELEIVRNDDNTIDIKYTKHTEGTFQVFVDFGRVLNAKPDTRKSYSISNNNGTLFKMKPIGVNPLPIQIYGFKYWWARGNSNTRKIDEEFVYALPIQNNEELTIYKGDNVNEKYFNKEKPESWTTFIIESNKSETINAMRKGKIVDINLNDDGSSPRGNYWYTSKTNHILLEHEDGSYALYNGFDRDSIFVNVGDIVYPYSKLGAIKKYDVSKYRLDFFVFYYDFKDYHPGIKSTKVKHVYLNPVFFSSKGNTTIEHNKSYQGLYDPDIVKEEMSWLERRRYKKHPERFQ